MVRRSLWLFALVLLASCARTPEPGTGTPVVAPPAPTTMSTEFEDSARQVITAPDGGAYVLGYRRESAGADNAEIYASRFDGAGKLQWLTVLTDEDLGDISRAGVSGVLLGDALYVLTNGVFERRPITLHKLELGGARLWSRVLLDRAYYVTDLVTAGGQLYFTLKFSEFETDKNTLRAVDAEGRTLWERVDDAVPAAGGADGGVYALDFGTLEKYGADGTLLWSEALEPGVPGFLENGASEFGPFSQMFVQGDDIYLTMTYLYETPDGPDDAAWNTEVRRYAADGTRAWTRLLYPEATGDVSTYIESLPLGVSADGSLYVLQEEGAEAGAEGGDIQVLRVSSEGTLFRGIPTKIDGFFGGSAADLALTSTTQTLIEGQPRTDAFYAVGGAGPLMACQIQPCPFSDAFLSLYTINGPDQPYTSLIWSAR